VSRRLQTSFASADESVGLLLWQVTNRWQAAVRAALRPHELTHVQFVLLASLTWLGGAEPVSQRDLAAHAYTDPMMTSQVLRALEARELVSREPHPDDGRAWAVAVTRAGAELANRANAEVEACDTAFFAALGADQAQFATGLRQLRGPD
jgi:DNA-binding MarR family transcriptional regulator